MSRNTNNVSFASMLLSTLLLSSQVNATPEEFKQAYDAYNVAFKAGNTQQAAQAAQQAYDLGQHIYGETSIDTTNLGFNLAIALSNNKQHEDAAPYYEQTLEQYKKHYGEDSVQLVDPLLTYADKTKDLKLAKGLLSKARKIASDSEQPILYAHTLSASYSKLVQTKYDKKQVRKYILQAKEIYSELLPMDSTVLVNSRFESSAVYLANKKYDQAEIELLEVIKQYQMLDYSHPYELAAHARLVTLYSQKNKAEQATEHCLAIGSMKPWSQEQQQTPIYRVNPNYPISKARSGVEGMVVLSFTVNEQGFVSEPEIVNSTGGKAFEDESIKVLEQWRYAPKFEDGKPVKAETRVRLDFTLG
ncbi:MULTISPECIES: TonB family protein [Shewanella]|uniref:TonB family protein n=1 Tax=Shewanella TaxID=22 RepID=UPI000E75111B|nr:TonB family protein [Shewanella japonica]